MCESVAKRVLDQLATTDKWRNTDDPGFVAHPVYYSVSEYTQCDEAVVKSVVKSDLLGEAGPFGEVEVIELLYASYGARCSFSKHTDKRTLDGTDRAVIAVSISLFPAPVKPAADVGHQLRVSDQSSGKYEVKPRTYHDIPLEHNSACVFNGSFTEHEVKSAAAPSFQVVSTGQCYSSKKHARRAMAHAGDKAVTSVVEELKALLAVEAALLAGKTKHAVYTDDTRREVDLAYLSRFSHCKTADAIDGVYNACGVRVTYDNLKAWTQRYLNGMYQEEFSSYVDFWGKRQSIAKKDTLGWMNRYLRDKDGVEVKHADGVLKGIPGFSINASATTSCWGRYANSANHVSSEKTYKAVNCVFVETEEWIVEYGRVYNLAEVEEMDKKRRKAIHFEKELWSGRANKMAVSSTSGATTNGADDYAIDLCRQKYQRIWNIAELSCVGTS
ncbi:hypothetical protein B484DRAFT_400593 [Ochromonadaceae sp. CCMP2298]|nr:hypothetical protein B484DRAFT_400593 [Ochromonadaceae sp. CCMP2298]